MDFHSLARKELQALCKKNKIPANLTNVAMADALKALEKVEGLNELGNAQQSPERTTKAEPRTVCRTSTRKKLVNVEPDGSQILNRTRRTTRRTVAEEADNENKNVNLSETPTPTNRKRGPAASTRRKIDTQLIECAEDEKREVKKKSDVAETPAIPNSRNKAPVVSARKKVEKQKDDKSAQILYGTRHSVRLLEKTMADLSLDGRKIEAVKIEGLCEEPEEVEQAKDLPDELLENECETLGALEDSKTNNDREVNQLPENECEMKHKVNEDNKSVECEVVCDENQNIDQFLGSESERNVELPNDSKANDTETTDYGAKLETETCVNSDNLSGLAAEDVNDTSDESLFLVENSDKAIAMIHETIEKGSGLEGMDSHLETEMEKELEGNQYESDDSSPFVMETENKSVTAYVTSDLVSSFAAEELNEDVSKSSEMNKQHMEKVESNAYEFNTDEIDAIDAQISDLADDGCHQFDSDSVKTLSSDMNEHHIEKVESDAYEFNTDDIDAISDLVDDDCHEFDSDSETLSESSEMNEQQHMEKVESNASDDFDSVSDTTLSESSEMIEQHMEKVESNANEHEFDSDSDMTVSESCDMNEQHMEKAENNATEFNATDAQISDLVEYGCHEFDSDSEKTPCSVEQNSPFCPVVSESEVAAKMTSDDGHVEEFAGIQKKPTSLKEMSPCVSARRTVSSPFSGNTIQGQFPRPTEGKSATKKQRTVEKIDIIINKENIDRVRESDDKALLNELSLRQLTKALKEKLQIKNNVSKMGTRPALQKLPENAGEPEA